MCVKHGFAEERIRKTAAKLMKNAGKATQGRMYSFFQVLPSKRKVHIYIYTYIMWMPQSYSCLPWQPCIHIYKQASYLHYLCVL